MLDKIKDLYNDLIVDTINAWVEEFLNWILTLINTLVFSIPSSDLVNTIMTFLAGMTSSFAIIIALYKIIEYQLNVSNGTQEYPLGEIFLRVFKSSAALIILPWFLKLIIKDVCLPIANYFAAAGSDLNGKGYEFVVKAIMSGPLMIVSGGFVTILFLIFFCIVFIMFFYSVCVFYADYIMMQILIAPVALSMIADDNNYYQVWYRELLSMVVSMLVKIFLVTIILYTIVTGGNILLAIGCGVLIIKSPSVLKNMWYGAGGARGASRGMMRGTGQIGSTASRVIISQLMK